MPSELSGRLAALVRWIDPGPGATHLVSDVSGWWRDPEVLARLGPALVEPFRAARPTVVVSPAVTGYLLGPLAATALGVGFVPAHKPGDGRLPAGALTWAQSPPDFRGRRVDLAVRDHGLQGVTGCWWWTTGWPPGHRCGRSTRSAPRGARNRSAPPRSCWTAPAIATELRVRGLVDGADLTA